MVKLLNVNFAPFTIDNIDHPSMVADIEVDGVVYPKALNVVDGWRVIVQPNSEWATNSNLHEVLEFVKNVSWVTPWEGDTPLVEVE